MKNLNFQLLSAITQGGEQNRSSKDVLKKYSLLNSWFLILIIPTYLVELLLVTILNSSKRRLPWSTKLSLWLSSLNSHLKLDSLGLLDLAYRPVVLSPLSTVVAGLLRLHWCCPGPDLDKPWESFPDFPGS